MDNQFDNIVSTIEERALWRNLMANAKNKKNKNLSFQNLIFNLQKFWDKQGCIILQPYDLELAQELSILLPHFVLWGLNRGRLLMFSHQKDQLMEDTERIQIDYNTIINIK